MQVRDWWMAGLLLAALTACSPNEPPRAAVTPQAVGPLQPSEPFGLTAVTLRAPRGGVALAVPVYDAHTPETRRRGLMGRKRLPSRTGMVFRFPEDRTGGFWMKDTLIPLSIAFFDRSGVVVAILDMEPCRQDPCPVYRPKARYRGALEVNQGDLAEIGVKNGWRVEVPFGLPPPT